ncbi:hypothetical protein GWC95_15745 [Sediminibacterium roseum]|uniref:HEPN AbiU2-like domain-containing protein n=1 Tax=Sediminibacterium roseum TaxID=1978412 RepID=A0ABW9ZYJ7_9BACT|nr:hypothetical protein [Sediminibacterium roseum]NCI51382.1 hypothetical protein [Sediminibacterium roseum]
MIDAFYIKDFPRGSSEELNSLAELLPICTDHLNTLNSSLGLIRRLKEIAANASSDILEPLSEIEIQGTFNAYLNLCFLDFIVIYKNALSAVHLWDDVYTLRQGYLLIYESIKTYNAHSKSLKRLCSKTPVTEEMFVALSGKLKKFRKDFDYDNNISEIRNYTIGHMDNDPVVFFNRISMFNAETAFAALREFVSVLISMLNLSEHIFVNYTKKIIKDSSFRLSGLEEYSIEIDTLLEALTKHTVLGSQGNNRF